MPNTPDDGERETSQDPVEDVDLGDAKPNPPSHQEVLDSVKYKHRDIDAASMFAAADLAIVPGEPGDEEIEDAEDAAKDEAAGRPRRWSLSGWRWRGRRWGDRHSRPDQDAARSAEQEDARDDIPWESGRPRPLVKMPDGTQLEVPDVDFEDIGPFWKTSQGRDMIRRALVISGGLGGLGVLVVLFLLFNGGEADTQTLDTTAATAQETDATGTDSGESVEESEEPLSAVEPTETALFVAALIACASPTQQDATGWRPSPRPGEEAREVAEIAAVTPVAKAFNLQCSGFGYGSYVFTMIVEGDAETVFIADGTTFNLRFVVNSTWPLNVYEDDTGFTVFIVWNRPAEVYVGSVNDSDSTRIPGATVDIVWLDASTLEATVTLPGDDIDVRNVRTELSGLVQDEQERTIAQYFDVAIWVAES